MRKILNIMLVGLVFVLGGCYSCESYHKWKGTGPVPPEVAEKWFFDRNCSPIAKAKPAPAPVKPKPAPVSGCGPSTVSRSYPCEGCEIIQLNKTMPGEVQLNAQFDYTIKVTNATDMTVANVVVTENIPGNLSVKSTNPVGTKDGGKLVWKLGSFAPKQSKRITVSGMATNTDCVKTCAAATYVVPACANVQVVQPKLQLKKTAPAEVLLCDPIPVKFVVTNSGSGSARNVKIEDTLPAGLRTAEGRSKLVFDAGTLATGQSRQFSATLKASKTGKYVNKAVASSAAGLKAESETTTMVRQPVLTISKAGPEKRYLGRSVAYEITVTNKGDAPAKNIIVEDQLPVGVKFVSASDRGKAAAGKVQWNLGTLMPDRSRKVSVTVMPNEAGTLTNTVRATATCAEGVRASVKTSVAGIPAVLLEVIDIDDPVEVGSQTTYVIAATNQGSAPGTNIRIVCTLEDSEQYVSSSGATRGTVEGNTITFAPLRSLAPKNKATWRVVVKALKPGDIRFTVIMNTDQLDRPVQETEATHLYE
jgi:uncharacterized repeat protein (TIGR01451 family)